MPSVSVKVVGLIPTCRLHLFLQLRAPKTRLDKMKISKVVGAHTQIYLCIHSRHSSVVEHVLRKRKVVGSKPTGGLMYGFRLITARKIAFFLTAFFKDKKLARVAQVFTNWKFEWPEIMYLESRPAQ